MKFKQLEVYGFKSFADKLQVKFGEGITAIVGPNGCGKSNVADSIRWVLGEQSAKLLRGKNMMDVIFNGTENRKSLSFCEVILHFDNTSRLFPSLDYNEVTISRKLYRSGESGYFINGNQCKLKDISDLLHDGGMGREGYSIIGQGRIDELLSAKPENRRAIFEEAAGISKYKARKTEAERKLLRTRENMVRIDDILGEKSRQLEPLTAQAEKARKCLDLRDKLKHHEINTYIYQHDTSEQAKEEISKRLNGVSEELTLREDDSDRLMDEYRRARDEYESGDANISALHEELTLLNVGIEKQTGEINNLRQRQQFLRENNQTLTEQTAGYDSDILENTATLARLAVAEKSAADLLTLKKAEYEKLNTRYLSIVDALSAHAGKAEEERRAEIEAMDKLSDIKSNMSALKAERQMLSERIDQQGGSLKEQMSRARTLEIQLKEYSDEADALIKQKNEESDHLSSCDQKHNELLCTANDLSDKLSGYNRTYYSASARFKLLKDMKESYDGFAAGVKNLLGEAKSKKDLSSRIAGTVAELIKVDQKFETAIEIALGGAYQNVVVATEDDANYLIDFLKANKLGRVTFMPVSAAKPRTIDLGYAALLKTDGCFGAASSLIGFDEKYRRVIEGYLGNTIVVRDKDVAAAISKKTGYSFKIVTLDGEVFAVSGAITGGSLKSDRSVANIFTHEREIRELQPQLKQLQDNIEKTTKAKESATAMLEALDKEIKQCSQNVHSLELSIAAKMEILNQLSSDKEEVSQLETVLSQSCQKDAARLTAIDDDLGSVSKLEEFLAGKRKSASESGQEMTQHLDRLRAESNELRETSGKLNVEINSLENAINYAQNDIKRLSAETEEMQIKRNSAVLLREKNDELIAEIERGIIELCKKNSDSDTGRITEIRAQIAGIDERRKSLAARISEIDTQREQLTDRLQILRDKKTEYAFQLQSVDTDIEMKEQKILEDYNLDYNQCVPFKEENYDINKGIQEVAKLKKSIYNLGDVNIGAIEQCKEAYEDYQKYSESREDLAKGEADLLKIIKELAADMLKLFDENFQKIRVNFIKTFKELFDGGSADLLLTEDESGDPLLAGIEIVAQPPQKKLQSISLLSGGERALTAIAILFAILKLRPMPFCVLDEIEAALDDANAGRFAKYLRRFSEDTQFIVITHRKPTMELSDSLYGVTMEEKGVSKIVSVKLSDAVAQAESIGA